MKITDTKFRLTKEHHGMIIKVGKRGFVRFAIKGMYEWWKDGFKAMRFLNDIPIYYKDGSWYKEIIS